MPGRVEGHAAGDAFPGKDFIAALRPVERIGREDEEGVPHPGKAPGAQAVFPVPEARRHIVHQQVGLFILVLAGKEVAAIHGSGDAVLQLPAVQLVGNFLRVCAVIGANALRRKVKQRAIHQAQRFFAAAHHAARGRVGDLVICGPGAQHLVHAVLLKKREGIVHHGRAGEIPRRAGGGRIGIRGDAGIHMEIGGVAQLAGIDFVVLAGTAPQAVLVHGEEIHIRAGARNREGTRLRKRRFQHAGHDQEIVLHRVQDVGSVQGVVGQAGDFYAVPGGKAVANAFGGDFEEGRRVARLAREVALRNRNVARSRIRMLKRPDFAIFQVYGHFIRPHDQLRPHAHELFLPRGQGGELGAVLVERGAVHPQEAVSRAEDPAGLLHGVFQRARRARRQEGIGPRGQVGHLRKFPLSRAGQRVQPAKGGEHAARLFAAANVRQFHDHSLLSTKTPLGRCARLYAAENASYCALNSAADSL